CGPVVELVIDSNFKMKGLSIIFKWTGCHQVKMPFAIFIKMVLAPTLSFAVALIVLLLSKILLTTFWGSYTLSSFSPLKFKVKFFPFVTSLMSGAFIISLPAHRISISLFINGGRSISIKGIPTLSGIGFHFAFFPFTKIVFIDPFHAERIN